MRDWLVVLIVVFILYQTFLCKAYAQAEKYNQMSNEIDFNRSLNQKWALELDVGQAWTSKPPNGNIFHSLSQLYSLVGVHYEPTKKWKLSFLYAYYYDKNLPEINQTEAPEWRSTAEAIYYIHRERSIITARMRLEDRHIKNADSVFEAVERLRLRIKMVYPINGDRIAKNILYGMSYEELMFKNNSKVSGPDFFDRNKFGIGLGFGITENAQIEFTYSNEYLPRSNDKSYNILEVNFVFSNLVKRIGNYIFDRKSRPEGSSGN
jgi:hypothetical protein